MKTVSDCEKGLGLLSATKTSMWICEILHHPSYIKNTKRKKRIKKGGSYTKHVGSIIPRYPESW